MDKKELIVKVSENACITITLLSSFYDMSSEAIWSLDASNAAKLYLELIPMCKEKNIDIMTESDETIFKEIFGVFDIDKFENLCKTKDIKYEKFVWID